MINNNPNINSANSENRIEMVAGQNELKGLLPVYKNVDPDKKIPNNTSLATLSNMYGIKELKSEDAIQQAIGQILHDAVNETIDERQFHSLAGAIANQAEYVLSPDRQLNLVGTITQKYEQQKNEGASKAPSSREETLNRDFENFVEKFGKEKSFADADKNIISMVIGNFKHFQKDLKPEYRERLGQIDQEFKKMNQPTPKETTLATDRKAAEVIHKKKSPKISLNKAVQLLKGIFAKAKSVKPAAAREKEPPRFFTATPKTCRINTR